MNNIAIEPKEHLLWQVLCGDKDHWRLGLYSPKETKLNELKKLEKHSCVEVFILVEGKITLVLKENEKINTLELEPFKPVLVDTWHNGFCPDGAFTGRAFVVERDKFETNYIDI